MNDPHPRRSALYLPASNTRAIEKAASLDCDAIVFDLEDAVAPDAKACAREQACRAVAGRAFGSRELVIRVNGMATPWHEQDLHAAIAAKPDAILIPKVETPEQVLAVASNLQSSDQERKIKLWCMLETPRGVLSSERIAGAHERVDCLVMGTSDLTSELHALHTAERLPLMTSLGLCVLAARAHGKTILDGVCLDVFNDEALRAACRQAREFGFDGKTLIHPGQIAPCNEVFSPTVAEVTRARAIIDAFARCRSAGSAVTVLDGQLIEELHVREAERALRLAVAIGMDDC